MKKNSLLRLFCTGLLIVFASCSSENVKTEKEITLEPTFEQVSEEQIQALDTNIREAFPEAHFALIAQESNGKIFQTGDLQYPYFMGNIAQLPYIPTVLEIIGTQKKHERELMDSKSLYTATQFGYGPFENEVATAVADFAVRKEAASKYNSGDHRFFKNIFLGKIQKAGVTVDLADTDQAVQQVANYLENNAVTFSLQELVSAIVKDSASWPLVFLKNNINEQEKYSDALINKHIANNVQATVEKILPKETNQYVTNESTKEAETGLFNVASVEEILLVFQSVLDAIKNPEDDQSLVAEGYKTIEKYMQQEHRGDHHLHLPGFMGRYGWWYHNDIILNTLNTTHAFAETQPSAHVMYVGRKVRADGSYIDIAFAFITPTDEENETREDLNIDKTISQISEEEKSVTKKVAEIIAAGVKDL